MSRKRRKEKIRDIKGDSSPARSHTPFGFPIPSESTMARIAKAQSEKYRIRKK